MKRVLLFVLVGIVCAPLAAQEPKIDFPAEIARIFGLKTTGQQSLDEGNYDAAVKAYREALDAQTRLLGADNPETLATTRLLVGVFEKQEKWEDAYGLLETLLDSQRRTNGEATEDVVWSSFNAAIQWASELMGWVDRPPKDLQRARDLSGRLRERSKPVEGALRTENALTFASQWIDACVEYRSGNAQQAIKLLEPAIDASANPYDCLALALFCGQAGETDRARDWFLAGWEMTGEGPVTDKGLLELNDKITSILKPEQLPPTDIAPATMVEVYSRLLAAYPNATDLYQRRAVCYLRIREWNKAAADFQRVVEKLPQWGWNWYHWGIVALHQGNLPEYKKACQEVLARCAKSKDGQEKHALVHLVFLSESNGIDAQQLPELVTANRGKTVNDDWVKLALYRCGRFKESQETPVESVSSRAVAAMAEHQLGNESRAKELLAECRNLIHSKLDPQTQFWPVVGTAPWSILEPEILLHEAEQLIEPQGKPSVPASPKQK